MTSAMQRAMRVLLLAALVCAAREARAEDARGTRDAAEPATITVPFDEPVAKPSPAALETPSPSPAPAPEAATAPAAAQPAETDPSQLTPGSAEEGWDTGGGPAVEIHDTTAPAEVTEAAEGTQPPAGPMAVRRPPSRKRATLREQLLANHVAAVEEYNRLLERQTRRIPVSAAALTAARRRMASTLKALQAHRAKNPEAAKDAAVNTAGAQGQGSRGGTSRPVTTVKKQPDKERKDARRPMTVLMSTHESRRNQEALREQR